MTPSTPQLKKTLTIIVKIINLYYLETLRGREYKKESLKLT